MHLNTQQQQQQQQTLVFAHRGGAGLRPENTIGAFRHALDLGVDGLELDVHFTVDDTLVVCHDPTIDRTTDGMGEIRGYTVEELKRFDAGCRWTMDGNVFPFAGRGYVIPSLRQVLEELKSADPTGTVTLSIDIKDHRPRAVDALIHLLGEFERLSTTIVGSFSARCVRRYRSRVSTAPTAFTRPETIRLLLGVTRPPARATHLMAPLRYHGVTVLTPRRVAGLRARGVTVGAWTINELALMERLRSWGLDILITDRPDRAVSELP